MLTVSVICEAIRNVRTIAPSRVSSPSVSIAGVVIRFPLSRVPRA
jgi:hypothetical protein